MNKLFSKSTLFLVLVLSGCSNENPSDVVIDFIYAVENKQFDDARELSTPDTDKLINLQESIANFSQDSTPFVKSKIEIIEERIMGDTAYVKFVSEEEDMPTTIKLVKTDGSWLVHVTKEDITLKAGASDEQEEAGFYEEDDYTDIVDDSLDQAPADSSAVGN
ncbi:MAG: DUF4878 domain-containing protein [Bacteroidota bacterium]